jgi:hypothetical protein
LAITFSSSASKREVEDATQQKIVETAVESSVPGLRLRLQFRIDPARADGDVGSILERVQQLLSILDGSRVIRVREQNDVAGCALYPVANGLTLAAINGVVDQANSRMLSAKASHNGGCVIRRSVVDYNHFGVPRLGLDECKHLIKSARNSFGFVVCGDDDAARSVFHN